MGKKHNGCKYFKSGWCMMDETQCLFAYDPSSCIGYETSGLDKNRTIERNRNRKAKSKRFELDDED